MKSMSRFYIRTHVSGAVTLHLYLQISQIYELHGRATQYFDEVGKLNLN